MIFEKTSSLLNSNIIVAKQSSSKLVECIKKDYDKIKLIDEIGVDGDYVESQAFGYLAIRSILKLPISFPETTGCKYPLTGGEIVKNF